MSKSRREPRQADVTRWVEILAAPEVRGFDRESRKIDRRERDTARGNLAKWGLGLDGLPIADSPVARLAAGRPS